jgi:hypothetical protein
LFVCASVLRKNGIFLLTHHKLVSSLLLLIAHILTVQFETLNLLFLVKVIAAEQNRPDWKVIG